MRQITIRTKSVQKIAGRRPRGARIAEQHDAQQNYLKAWVSVHAPKGTPKVATDMLEKWFNQIAVAEDTKTWLKTVGNDPFPGNSKVLRELLKEDIVKWGEYVKLAKIEPIG